MSNYLERRHTQELHPAIWRETMHCSRTILDKKYPSTSGPLSRGRLYLICLGGPRGNAGPPGPLSFAEQLGCSTRHLPQAARNCRSHTGLPGDPPQVVKIIKFNCRKRHTMYNSLKLFVFTSNCGNRLIKSVQKSIQAGAGVALGNQPPCCF